MATINVLSIINSTIRLCRENDSWTSEQIISEVLKKLPIQDFSELVRPDTDTPIKTKTKTKKNSSDSEKKIRAPPKPRALPEDTTRCSARSFYENIHLEGGTLKVMRDDSSNLFGDRCKFKKSGDTEFCKHHTDKQPLGVWDGEYSGKFKMFVNKIESESEDKTKPSNTKSIQTKKVESICDKPKNYDDASTSKKSKGVPEIVIPPIEEPEEFDENVHREQLAEQMNKRVSEKNTTPINQEDEDEENITVEDIEIDGVTYAIDNSGTVYDTEDNEVGTYDTKNKKWIERI